MRKPIPKLTLLLLNTTNQLMASSPARVALIIVAALCLAGCSHAAGTPEGVATPFAAGSGVWIGHGYLTTSSLVNKVPDTANYLWDEGVRTWFVNVGRLDADGNLDRGAAAVPQMKTFLAAVARWEATSGHRLRLFGWLSGSSEVAGPRGLDLNQPVVRGDIAATALSLASAAAPSSLVSGSVRVFDGVQLDVEPSGGNPALLKLICATMDQVRAALPPDCLTSFCLHKLGDDNRYWSNAQAYYDMAQHTDVVCAMTYDSGLTDPAAFAPFMQAQTVGLLRAVSGETWKNDAAHPAPKAGTQLFVGFPAFPPNAHHNPAVENIAAAATGTRTGLAQLEIEKSAALSYFAGPAIYLYTDGTGADHYAARDTDWLALDQNWRRP